MTIDSKLSQAQNYFDLNSLNNIRVESNASDKASKDAALKEAAKQFESIFMQMLLKSMREAEDVLASDSPFNSQSTKFYRDMQDQQMALEMSNNGSLGLADLIVRQLGGDPGNYMPASALRMDNGIATTQPTTNATAFAERFLNKDQQIAASTSVEKVSSNIRRSTKDPQTEQIAAASEQAFAQPKDFVTALTEPAQKVQQQLGIPFEVVIAQAALETGWGQKIIKNSAGQSSNNLFNIKADSRWQGDKTYKNTLEFEGGQLVKKNEPFRMYTSLEESASDYVSFLSKGERYQDALNNPSNVEHFLHKLQKAGYATDPNYAQKILGTLGRVTELLSN